MRGVFLSILLLVLTVSAASGAVLNVDAVTKTEPLMPYLNWLADPEGTYTLENVSSPLLSNDFSPLAGGVPLKDQGPVWAQLLLVKTPPSADGGMPSGRGNRVSISLGKLPPGKTVLYLTEAGSPLKPGPGQTLASYEPVALPDPGLDGLVAYLRMDETPGFWFAPVISPLKDLSPPLVPPDLLLPGLLLLGIVVCLLRAVAEKILWPFWAALFLGCVLAECLLPLPILRSGIRWLDLPALLAPGTALILLPHVGRCLFRKSGIPGLLDSLLALYSLPGLALCLAPLAPGMGWLLRLFPLWPLLLTPLLPLCLSVLAGKRPGALVFTGACALPVIGAATAFYAIAAPF